jgi:hydrogenase maturation protease
MPGILLIGYGNPGRGDDGLGPALAEAISAQDIVGVRVESEFQLNVEDALAMVGQDAVVFADAATEGEEPFFFRELGPEDTASFSSHSVSPAGLLGLSKRLFGAHTKAYVLGIRGYHFDEFGAPMSPQAKANLSAAMAYLEPKLRSGHLEN